MNETPHTQEQSVTLERAGEMLGLPATLLMLRVEDGRLPCRNIDSETLCSMADVVALKAKEAATDGVMRQLYKELDDLDTESRPR